MASEPPLLSDIEQEWGEEEESPEERACWFSRLFFCWMTPLLWRSSRSALTEDHVLPIREKWTSAHLKEKWDKQWARSVVGVFYTVPPPIIKRIREAQGLGTANGRYGHSVREANRLPRVTFCRQHLDSRTMFIRHCFTDESMVQVGTRGRLVFILKGDNSRRVRPRHKFPGKLMIWGGISWQGATPLVILNKNTTVDGGVFQKMIHDHYLEWAERIYGGNVALVQDNARCHTSLSTQIYLQQQGVETLEWPAESPDLNPVEIVWGLLKNWLRTTNQPTNLTELKRGITEWWETKITIDLCRSLILRTQNQMTRVLEAQGGPVYD